MSDIPTVDVFIPQRTWCANATMLLNDDNDVVAIDCSGLVLSAIATPRIPSAHHHVASALQQQLLRDGCDVDRIADSGQVNHHVGNGVDSVMCCFPDDTFGLYMFRQAAPTVVLKASYMWESCPDSVDGDMVEWVSTCRVGASSGAAPAYSPLILNPHYVTVSGTIIVNATSICNSSITDS